VTEVIFEESSQAETSLQAFKNKVQNGSLESDREKVLHLVRQLGPITSQELQMWMNKPKHKFSGRLTDLVDDGLIHATGVVDNHKQWEARY
jgi:predicted HTH transcriptional regulator